MNITGKLQLLEPADHWESVMELDQAHFPMPWSHAQWQGLDMRHHLLFAWHVEEKLAGYALFGIVPGDEMAHLYKVLMHPGARGTGQTHQFWQEILAFLKAKHFTRIYLEVESGNARAIGFYQKEGFNCLRRNKGYYSNGEDALIMECML